LNDHIALLCKRRAQLKQVVQAIVSRGFELVSLTPDKETKYQLIETLRDVSAGKIFVELERARLTKILASMKEEEGRVGEAADIMQEIQVETVGSMEKREKAEFLLEQMRLNLDKRDYVRTELISRKVNRKVLEETEMQDLKVRFYELLIRFYENSFDYLEISKSFHAIYMSPLVQGDSSRWKRVLKLSAIYCILSPHDPEQHDRLLLLKNDKRTAEIPSIEQALALFTTKELMTRPTAIEDDWKDDIPFVGEYGKEAINAFIKRIHEHNIRVIAGYYSKIRKVRLAQLLQLDVDTTEKYISEMVSDKALSAKIDRPAEIVVFGNSSQWDANTLLNNWSSNISTLLNLVEKTVHLINKENMMHNL